MMGLGLPRLVLRASSRWSRVAQRAPAPTRVWRVTMGGCSFSRAASRSFDLSAAVRRRVGSLASSEASGREAATPLGRRGAGAARPGWGRLGSEQHQDGQAQSIRRVYGVSRVRAASLPPNGGGR